VLPLDGVSSSFPWEPRSGVFVSWTASLFLLDAGGVFFFRG
jgi:hypothetical protein